MKRILWFLLVGFLGLPMAQAASLEDSYQLMCNKLKSCALKSVNESDLSPDMRNMILQSMEGACISLQQQFSGVVQAHPLYEPANACLQSMAALSCDEIENQDEQPTPACARYEKMAVAAP